MRNHGNCVNNIIPGALFQGVDLYKIHKTILYILPIAIVFSILLQLTYLQICFVNKTILRFAFSLGKYKFADPIGMSFAVQNGCVFGRNVV